MQPIPWSARLRIAPDQLSTELDEEVVILSFKGGKYFGLSEVGARVWKVLRDSPLLGEIRDRLVAEYDVDQKRCEKDLLNLVKDLRTHGIVEIVD